MFQEIAISKILCKFFPPFLTLIHFRRLTQFLIICNLQRKHVYYKMIVTTVRHRAGEEQLSVLVLEDYLRKKA